MDEILKRIAAEPPSAPGVPRRPSRDLLAMLVRMGRSMRSLKAQALADFAGVSLSTLERVERGEAVSDAALERIGTTLGYKPGDFTAERIPLSQEEAYASIERDWGGLVTVSVAPLAKQTQLRALSRCHAMLKLGRGYGEPEAVILDELAEWIDLIGFVRSEIIPSDGSKRMRELYRDTLGCVEKLRGAGMTVLAGVWPCPKPGIPEFAYAVLAISPRALDPGAAKRRHIILDGRDIERTPLDWGPI